jgi:hypothetical protein
MFNIYHVLPCVVLAPLTNSHLEIRQTAPVVLPFFLIIFPKRQVFTNIFNIHNMNRRLFEACARAQPFCYTLSLCWLPPFLLGYLWLQGDCSNTVELLAPLHYLPYISLRSNSICIEHRAIILLTVHWNLLQCSSKMEILASISASVCSSASWYKYCTYTTSLGINYQLLRMSSSEM